MSDVVGQFRGAIQSAGLIPPDVIEQDGKLHRFAANGKRDDDAGFYVLHGDGIPAGSFGDWRTGQSQTWRADIGRKLTPAEDAAHRAKAEAMQREREAERVRQQAEATAKAGAIWKAAQPAPEDHPYLTRKGIKANGARLHNDALVIPMRDSEGVLHSLQFIGPDGDKRFLAGGRVKGCYFGIGNPKGAAALCIDEGFATGATIHEATGYPAAVAFNAGNLRLVARAMREKFPDLPLIFCADDDYRTGGNPGLTKATEAARSVGGLLAIPEFGADRPDKATDFNDMAMYQGREAVRIAIANACAPDKETYQPAAVDAPASSRIIALDISELLMRDFPPMEPLLAPWLCKQHVDMVYAWRGVGKTHFAFGVAYAVAGGGKFLKWKADKPRRVVYIDGEMAGAAIKARLAAIVESAPDEHEPPEGYLRIITPDIQDLPLPDLASWEGQAALEPCIADAELIVVDNLSCLMRGGAENEGEAWMPVAEWALRMRKQGKAVLFVHHAGKAGQQRGSSRREDLMDVVIKLEHATDYQSEQGASFLVNFEKARQLSGDDARDIEAALTKDEHGKQVWTWKDADLGMADRILALHAEAPDLSQSDIAEEVGCNRSTVSRALKKAKQQGAGGLQ
jgi:putative DNA primase/helicase